MNRQDRRRFMAALPLVPASFMAGTSAQDKPEAPPLLRYLAIDRLDRTLAEEERALVLEAQRLAEDLAEGETRLRDLPEMRAAKEEALNTAGLSPEGQEYLRQESVTLMQEEQGLRPKLPQLSARQSEADQRLSKLRQRRAKLAAELASIERFFQIRFPE